MAPSLEFSISRTRTMPRWAIAIGVTLASWGVWAVLSKWGEQTGLLAAGDRPLSASQCQALSTVGLAPILAALWPRRGKPLSADARRGIALAVAAGIVSSLGNIAYYAAVAQAKAATLAPLTALSPAVTILLAIPLLGERPTARQGAGMAASLAAIYFFIPPGEREWSRWVWLASLPLVLWGVTLLLQKMTTNLLSARDAAFWFLAAFVPVGAAIAWYDPLPAGVRASAWEVSAAIGFTLALGNYTLLAALAEGGDASIVGPLAGLYPLVSIPLAVAWLGEQIGGRELIGMAIALGAVVLLTYEGGNEKAAAPAP